MKARITEPVQEALAALRPNRNFEVFLGWLRQNLEETRIQNDDLSGEELTRNQGCAKTLAKILKTVDGAE
jgi:hypothetical protein